MEEMDDDVKQEEEVVRNGTLDVPVQLKHLYKIFAVENGIVAKCRGEQHDEVAVSDLSFYIEANTLFCLLGHNGAGKVRKSSKDA